MLRTYFSRRLQQALGRVGVFFCLAGTCLTQSVATNNLPAYQGLALKSTKTRYLPQSRTITLTLSNIGPKTALAYSVELSAFVHEKEITPPDKRKNFSRELLDIELFRECRNAPGNSSDEDASPWPEELRLPQGAIRPGTTYTASLPADPWIEDLDLKNNSAEIRARVTGVLWVDGTIDEPAGGQVMLRYRQENHEVADEEHKALAIVNPLQADGNIQHRINAAVQGLESLKKDYPREVHFSDDQPRDTFHVGEAGTIGNMLLELDQAAYVPDSIGRYSYLIQFWTCVSKHRSSWVSASYDANSASTAKLR